MGISNIASNLRPGICTSSTRPTTPYEGQVIYETDTNRTLVWDNAAWVDPSTGKAGRSGLVKITPTSVSGTGASIQTDGSVLVVSGGGTFTVENCFNSSFENYEIIISDMTLGTDSGTTMQLRNSGGTSTSGYYYGFAWGSGFYNGTGISASSLANQSAMDLRIIAAGAGGGGGRVLVTCPNLAKVTGFSATSFDPRVTGSAIFGANGYHNSNTSYTSLVFGAGATTFTRCRVNFYGYN